MTLEDNVKAYGITYFGLGDKRQGIVHVIGPEQGTIPPSYFVYEEKPYSVRDQSILVRRIGDNQFHMLTQSGFTLPGTTVVCGRYDPCLSFQRERGISLKILLLLFLNKTL